jgi:hypothetical protein
MTSKRHTACTRNCVRLQTLMTVAKSNAFVAHLSTTKSQSVVIKTTSSKHGSKNSTKGNRENCIFVHCGMVGHLKKNCQKLKADKNKSAAT